MRCDSWLLPFPFPFPFPRLTQQSFVRRLPNGIRQLHITAIHFCMMKTEPGWELYRSFLAVIREKSLSGAARALSLTQPTLGRHIATFEEALGVILFTRSQAGLIATHAALPPVKHARGMGRAAGAPQGAPC